MTATPPEDPLDTQRLRRDGAALPLGHTLHYFEDTDSTNTRATELARQGAAEGTIVIAEAQSKGRGRLGRTWSSPARRNLYLSVIIRSPAAATPEFALVLGVAVGRAIRAWAADAKLKWPNDVLIGNRKVSGVLTEVARLDTGILAVIAGIGVNLNMNIDEFPTELHAKATSLAAATGAWIDRTAFTQRLLIELSNVWIKYRDGGFVALRAEWESLADWIGRTVEIDDGGERIRGQVLGLDEGGALLVRRADGSTARIEVGDVTVVDGYAPRD